MTITPVYFDKRHKFEQYCFNTNNDGFIEVHRFEDKSVAERTQDSLRKQFNARLVGGSR